MLCEQRHQPLSHDQSRSVRRHVHFDLALDVNDSVRVGRFQDVAVLGDDHGVPVDQFFGRAIFLSIVTEQDLHQLDTAVIDRRCRIENDVAQPGRVFDVERPAEWHEPRIAHVPRGDGVGGAGHAIGFRRVVNGHDGLGAEAVIGFDELIFLRLRPILLPESGTVDEREVRVVERVLHHA